MTEPIDRAAIKALIANAREPHCHECDPLVGQLAEALDPLLAALEEAERRIEVAKDLLTDISETSEMRNRNAYGALTSPLHPGRQATPTDHREANPRVDGGGHLRGSGSRHGEGRTSSG